ncbi:hypothetical protein PIB30_075831 [Stylosanthes scabra]|uniref:Uncharacterized protein n=1 Tax=Stylosanthes scabra TaxID=79078 RepID=A0ABU6XQQ6_9FABA|nr:hypothetical protein [Stylosanthes scabra]
MAIPQCFQFSSCSEGLLRRREIISDFMGEARFRSSCSLRPRQISVIFDCWLTESLRARKIIPLFLSDEEFARCSGDTATVAAKADAYIRSLLQELDTLRARSQAVDINAEQNCSIVEQKDRSLAADFSALQSRVSELESELEQSRAWPRRCTIAEQPTPAPIGTDSSALPL